VTVSFPALVEIVSLSAWARVTMVSSPEPVVSSIASMLVIEPVPR
jgi:hypothetical protein